MRATIAILASVIWLVGPALAEEGHYGKQKVVYHINSDDPDQQVAALRNIQNHINAVGADNLDLKVVMHGDGVSLLLYPDAVGETKMARGNATEMLQARVTGLKNQGIGFQVCANTLQGRQIDPLELYDVAESDIVPSGVAELARLQALGYTYIKP
jgi:intracellular sulfur oxidation DsrE/DsrF family protein